MKKFFKRAVCFLLAAVLCLVLVTAGINIYVKTAEKDKIRDTVSLAGMKNIDCILVLGCGVYANNKPSDMLRDRLLTAIELYKSGSAKKIIMSGDHGSEDYDEVNVMKSFAIEAGVPSEDIFMDHAGFSTYESMYRAKAVFGVSDMIVVTQKYHLYRALFIAESMNITAYGADAAREEYAGQLYRDLREILAVNKDFLTCIFKPEPTYLGDPIEVMGDGNVTNDK